MLLKSNEILRRLKILPLRFLSNIIFIKDLSLDKQAKITKLKIIDLTEFNDRNSLYLDNLERKFFLVNFI